MTKLNLRVYFAPVNVNNKWRPHIHEKNIFHTLGERVWNVLKILKRDSHSSKRKCHVCLKFTIYTSCLIPMSGRYLTTLCTLQFGLNIVSNC